MRSIKRIRQIEDLVVEKLTKRGYLTSREPDCFVKNLDLDETFEKMTKRTIKKSQNLIINKDALFQSEKRK